MLYSSVSKKITSSAMKLGTKIKSRMKMGMQKFSIGTSMHGFAELYLSKSMFFTLTWIAVIIGSLIMTAYQVNSTVAQYFNQPEAVSLEPLSPGDLIIYPNLQLCYQHWIYWVDFEKAKKLNFTKTSVLYGLSYVSEVFAENPFDIDEARRDFFLNAKSNNFTTLSHFFQAIARWTPENGDAYVEKKPDDTYFGEPVIKLIYALNMPVFCYSIPGPVIVNKIRENFGDISADIDRRIKNVHDHKTFTFLIADEEMNLTSVATPTEYNCYLAQYFFMYSDRYVLTKQFNKIKDTILPRLPMLLYVDEFNTFEVKLNWKWSEVNIRVKASVYDRSNSRGDNGMGALSCTVGSPATSTDNTCESRCETDYSRLNCLCPHLGWMTKFGFDQPDRLCSYKIYFLDQPLQCTRIMTEKYDNSTTNFNARVAPVVAEYPVRSSDFCENSTLDESAMCCVSNSSKRLFRSCLNQCRTSKSCEMWTHEISVSTTNSEASSFDSFTGKPVLKVNILYPTEEDILYTKKINIQSWDNLIGNVGGLLGVWTGASIISIYQLFYLCCCADCTLWPRNDFFNNVNDKRKRSLIVLKNLAVIANKRSYP